MEHASGRRRPLCGVLWQLFADWCECNPPNIGPIGCAAKKQPLAFCSSLRSEVAGVPQVERERLARFVISTGRRINANLGYA